jgi:hypothetical protein
MSVDAVPAVSVVVPMLNAEGRVEVLHERLAHALHPWASTTEIILVDDGSTDSTWRLVERLARQHPEVIGLRLRDNVGQTGALCAGFSVARGNVVAILDDDLETDPVHIRPLIRAVEGGATFASGWRTGPRPAIRALGSRLYNVRLRQVGLPFHDAGCGTNAMTNTLAQALAEKGWLVRQHRFKPVVAQLTDSIVEVRVPVRRSAGSHQTLVGLAASWLDVELAFDHLHLPTYVAGAVVAPALSGCAALIRAARDAARGRVRPGPLLGACCLLGASLLASRVLQVRLEADRMSRCRPPWDIADRVGPGEPRATRGDHRDERGTPRPTLAVRK